MSFNSFISTSKNREVPIRFAKMARSNKDIFGILFVMNIDPTITLAPFASIAKASFYRDEAEVLFSMHTIFRINEVRRMEKPARVFELHLTLTADDDEQLRTLTQRLAREVKGSTGWKRMGQLLIKLRQIEKAEELYMTLLKHTSDQTDRVRYIHQLGYVKDQQGHYSEAVRYYKEALEMYKTLFPDDHSRLANLYSSIALVYDLMGECSRALSFYDKTLAIYYDTLSTDHPSAVSCYNNIGLVYEHKADYREALSFYEKALAIYQRILPPNHPNLATSYNNIGGSYEKMGEYEKALKYFQRSLNIRRRSLPPNHPDIRNSTHWIELVKKQM